MKTRKAERPGKSKYREEWLCGLNPVRESIRSGREIREVFIGAGRKGDDIDELERVARSRGIRVSRRERPFFDEMFRKGHQGIAARAAPREFLALDDLLPRGDHKASPPFFIFLDCVEDPGNFGAILRTAAAAGTHGVVIQEHRSAPLGPGAVKASAGASEFVPIARIPNIKNAIRRMQEEGIRVIGVEACRGAVYWESDMTGPLAVVIGSEGKGLRRTVADLCDEFVHIPMAGQIQSLNASVAAALVVYEVLRQRQKTT